MRLLLIEDDEHKARQIIDYLKSDYNEHIDINQKRSYQSGIKEALKNDYDIILLDMSMPAFDRNPNQLSTNFRHFAGRDVLMELNRRNKIIKTVIVTQFDVFGEGKNQMDAMDLDKHLEEKFPNIYQGMIHYNASLSNWKAELLNSLNRLL
ncbi:response regulator [Bacillus megaterium]|nr:response regulator [Priestia megaterium]